MTAICEYGFLVLLSGCGMRHPLPFAFLGVLSRTQGYENGKLRKVSLYLTRMMESWNLSYGKDICHLLGPAFARSRLEDTVRIWPGSSKYEGGEGEGLNTTARSCMSPS